MSRALFACTTPYQVMGAIGIVSAEKTEADLILFGMFEGYEDVAARIREAGLFREVTAVAPDRYKAPGRKAALKQMLRARSVSRDFLAEGLVYDRFYSSSRAHIKNILLHELIRRNKGLKIIIYDDGMGTYDGDSHVLNTTDRRKKAERLLGWDLYRPERIEYLVYEPGLFTKPKGYEACAVKPMPKPGEREETMAQIARVFGVTEKDEIPEKVIIFDPYRGADRERDRILPEIDRCYEAAAEAFGRGNVIVKPHPRSLKRTEADVKVYAGSGIPMEALYAGMRNLEERVLVTYASTAVYTPKVLFGKEPRVIALFRITDGEESEWRPQFEKFRGLYKEKERMTAPGSLEELESMVRKMRL